MPIVIIVNAVLAGAVTVGILALLISAIAAQHRDEPAGPVATRRRRRVPVRVPRRGRIGLSAPVAWRGARWEP